jgi:hypothetical protein
MTEKHTAFPLTASIVWAQGNGETTANFILDANWKIVAWAAKPEDAALIVQAVNEREGLVRDAERYRWLQEAPEADWRECSMLTKEETSQFIDAAIDEAKGAP